jgi:glycosyltransferase involved in cell wall biosynthesis
VDDPAVNVDAKRVALLVAADLTDGRSIRGGVVRVAQFLWSQLAASGRYQPHLISVATSAADRFSVRLVAPRSWRRHKRLLHPMDWDGYPVTHAGCVFPELEFQRYMPRRELTRFLDGFDLVQVITGTPAIGYATRDVSVPVCLQVATTARLERGHVLRTAGLVRQVNGKLMLPVVDRIERKALALARHVFADTEYTANALAGQVPRERMTVDTIGVDTELFAPGDTRADDYILCVGRLSDPRKNVRLLFDAYRRLREMLDSAPRLVLAGIGAPSEADWAHAVALGIRDQVVLHTSPGPERLADLYRNAAMYVLSSNEEGLGIVLLEALASATPVVSTRCGGPEYVVTPEVGLLTPVGDSVALSVAMAQLWRSPEQRREMGETGRRMMLERFADGVVGRKFINVYERLLTRAGAAGRAAAVQKGRPA